MRFVRVLTITTVCAVSSIGAIGWWISHRDNQILRSKAASCSAIPHTVQLRCFTLKPGESPILTSERLTAVRSDDAESEREIGFTKEGKPLSTTRSLWFPDGLRVDANETLKLMTAIRSPNTARMLQNRTWNPDQRCAVSVSGATMPPNAVVTSEAILGYDTFKIAIGSSSRRFTMWKASALGCADVRVLYEQLDPATGRVVLSSDSMASSIQSGEPDPNLFDLPKRFENVAPSERARREAAQTNNPNVPAGLLAGLAEYDAEFAKYRYDP